MKRQNIRKILLIVSFLFFPITIYYFSPYLIILGAADGIVTGSFIMFTALFLLSLFFGRAFCGFVCATGGLQECLTLASNKKTKGGKLNLIKYCIWVPWFGSIVFLFLRAGGFLKADFLFMTENGISVAEPFAYIIYYGVVLFIVILALTSGKRAFCHYVCWMSPFMVIGAKTADCFKIPRLRLEPDKTKCTGCGRCSEKCPMSLDVSTMVENESMQNSECILCGECIDICTKKAVRYTFKR